MAKEFTYKMNIDAEISGLTSKLKTVKDALASVTSEGKEPKISRILDQLTTKIDNLKTKANTPIKAEGAFTSMEKEVQSIDRLLEGLGGELDRLTKKTATEKISFLPPDEQKRLLSLVNAMKAYDKAIVDVTKKGTELTKAEEAEERAKGALERANKKLAADKTTAKTAQETRDAAKAALDSAEARAKAAKEAQKEYEFVQKQAAAAKAAAKDNEESIDLRSAHFKTTKGKDITLNKARSDRNQAAALANQDDITALSDAYKIAKSSAEGFNAQVGRSENAVIRSQEALTQATAKVKDLNGAWEQQKLDGATNAFAALRQEAQNLGVSLKGIGADDTPENIAALKERINECIEQGVVPGNEKIQEAINVQHNMATATKETSVAIEKNTEAFRKENEQAKQVDGLMSRIKQFTGITGVALVMRRALQSAINTTKELDKQMTAMAVVTDLKVGDYWKQLPEHTEQANKLGVAIKDVYEAETLYYQQGLKSAQVQKLTTSTLKMARIAGLSAEDATNKMTAALRGFNMEINETNADRIADVYSKLAAITASNVKEISTAMTKTASLASNAGMEFETTAAFLSQIIETTRESAETAGTALKTVIARFQELKKSPEEIGEIDGEIVDANKIETALRTVGVALRDTEGQFRNLDEVFLELSSKWDTLDTNTQRYIATIAAGSRQQSRFIAMMSNYARTQELVTAANNATGASNEQFQKTLDSLQSKLAQLKNAWDTFTQGLANNEFIKTGVQILTGLVTIINKITQGFGPWSSSALKIGMVTAALIAGDKAIRIFTTSMKGGSNVVVSFGNVFKAAGLSVKNFALRLMAQTKAMKGHNTITTNGIEAIQARKKAEQALSNANATVAAHEKKIADLRAKGNVITDAQVQEENKLNIAKTQQAAASEGVAKAQEQEALALGLSATQQEVYNAMVGAGVTEETAAILAKAGLTAASWANMQAAYGEGAATHAAELAQKLQNAGLIKGTIIKWNDQIATIAQAAANGTYTGSAVTATIAQWAMNIAVKAGCPPFLALGLVILMVVAAIAVLVLAIIGIIALFKKIKAESPEGKFKAAEEALKLASEQAQMAADAYKELKDSLKDLQSKYDALDNLVVGTEEWRDMLLEVNNQVMDLIDKYPELAEGMEIDSNGVMRITEETMRKVEDKAADEVARTNTAKLAATIRKNKAHDDLRYSQLSTTATAGSEADAVMVGISAGMLAGSMGPVGGEYAGMAGAAIYGAGSGSSWGMGLATALGGPIGGAIAGGIAGKDVSRAINREVTDTIAKELAHGDMMDESGNLNQEKLRTRMKELGMDDYSINEWLQNLAQNSGEAAKELRKYGQELEATTAANKAAMQTMISNSLAMVDATKFTSEQLQQMAQIGTALMDQTLSKANAEMSARGDKKRAEEGNLVKDADYLEYWEGIYGEGNVKIGAHGKVKVKNDKGKFKEAVSAEEAVASYAAAEAAEDMAKKMEFLPKALEKAGKGVLGLNKAINSAFKDDEGMGLSRQELNSLSKNNLAYIWQNNKEFQEIYESYDAFIEEMTNRTELAQEAFVENEKKLKDLGLGNFKFDQNLTSGAEKGLVEHMNQIVAASGVDSARRLGNSINYLLSEVAIEDRDKLAAQLNAIDWHDADALEDLPKTLKELGISLPEDQLKAFIEQAKTAADAIHKVDLTKLNEDLISINKTLKSMRTNEQDRVFDKDVYEALINADEDLKKYFRQDLEGNFIFLGSNLSILTDAVIKATDALVDERTRVLTNSIEARKIIESFAKSGATLKSGTVMDAKNYNLWDTEDKKEFIKSFIEEAETKGVDLTGINAYLSENTDVEKLEKESLDSILASLSGLGTVQSLEKELNEEVVQANVTRLLRDNASLNPYSDYNKKLRENGELSSDEMAWFRAARQATLVEAKGNGVSEQDYKLLTQYNELLLKYEEAHLTNTRIYKQLVQDAAKANADLQTRSSFQTMYEGMKENITQANELVQVYNDTTSALEKQHLVAQMVSEFQLQVTEENEALYESYVDAMIHGSDVAFQNLINLSGHAITGAAGLYKWMDEQYVSTIENMGSQYEKFMRIMEDAHYGWIETIEKDGEKLQIWHWGLKEAADVAKEIADEIEGWLNPYDWLYNANQQINAQLRERERLERDWTNALKDNNLSVSQMADILAGEVAITRQVVTEQQQIYDNAAKQVGDFVEYVNSQGLEGFANAFAVGPNGQIIADKKALFAANLSSDAGGLGEEEIDRIAELIDTMKDAEDQINEANDYLKEIKKTGKEEYNTLVDRISEALRQQYQREIDTLSAINDTISDAASQLVDKLQEKIDDDRSAREKEETEKNLTDKQAQLAYLQASGGSALDILKLQKEIDQDQQSYTDSLVDSAIDEMTRANQQAADQRQEQIDIAQAQFDWWSENDAVHDAEEILNSSLVEIANGLDPTKTGMAELLEREEKIQTKTKDAISDWDTELGVTSKLAAIHAGLDKDVTVQSKVNTVNDSISSLNANLTSAIGDTTTAAQSVAQNFTEYYVGNKELLTAEKIELLTNTTTTDTDAQQNWWANELNKIKYTTVPGSGDVTVKPDLGTGGTSGPNVGNAFPGLDKNADLLDLIPELNAIIQQYLSTNPQGDWRDYLRNGKGGDTTLSNGQSAREAFNSLDNAGLVDSLTANRPTGSTTQAKNSLEVGVEFPDYKYWYNKNRYDKHNIVFKDLLNGEVEQGIIHSKNNSEYATKFQGSDQDAYGWAALNGVANHTMFGYAADGKNMGFYLMDSDNDKAWKIYHADTGDGLVSNLLWEAEDQLKNYSLKRKYETGGLADFTGPAWLDGTKSNPELVLNQTDTANFIELKNVLADILKGSSTTSSGMGNNYYNIDVHVDSIDSDYDIDSAAAHMKELIENDAMYRNVNAIQQIR